MRSAPIVRRATVADGAAIGHVSVASWQVTYRGLFRDEYLDALDPAQRSAPWIDRLTTAADRTRECVLVIELDGEVVGFSAIGPSPHDLAQELGELWTIYLHPAVIGRGFGHLLFTRAVSELLDRGFAEAVLWVAERNDRARRFYERQGWWADGTTKIDESFGEPITEVRYRTSLARQ